MARRLDLKSSNSGASSCNSLRFIHRLIQVRRTDVNGLHNVSLTVGHGLAIDVQDVWHFVP